MALFSKLFKAKKSNSKETSVKTQTPPTAKPQAPQIDLATLATTELLDAILQVADANACITALERLNSEDQYITLASQHSIAAVRIAAAEKVVSFAALQQLQTLVKNKDKAVFRLCKTRLNEQRDAQQQQQARLERIEYLLNQVNYLNKIGYHPEFSGKLQLIKQEWPEFTQEASAETQTQMQEALAVAQKTLEQHVQEEQAIAAQQQAVLAAQAEQLQLIEQADSLLEQAHGAAAAEFEQQVQALSQAWDANFRIAKPEAEQNKAFEQRLQQLLSIQTVLKNHTEKSAALTQWLEQDSADATVAVKQADAFLALLSWPDGIVAPSWQAALLQKITALKIDRKEQQHSQKELQAQAERDLTAFEKAIKEGHVKEANKFNQRVSQALKQLPNQGIQSLRRQQQALFAQLQEMRDWAGFATLPKKEALISTMQELIGSPVAPDLLADKIHSLQEEWKALSNAGVRDSELWQQFNQAAEQAFEPCKAYFAEQAELRKALVEQRLALIAELSHYEQAMDWSNADWRAVQKTLDTARQTFRTLGPVDRAQHSKTQEQFNQVCDRIFAYLKQQYEGNLELKRQLIEQAQELVVAEKLQGIVDKVKALQAQWQEIGVTPRGPDQKLWKQFREQCDAIFKRLDEQRQERKAEINETVTQAESLVAQALESGDDNALKEANQHIHSISLPKAVFQRLNKDLQGALSAKQQAAKQEALAGLFARLENLHGSEEQWQQACALPLATNFNAESFEQARNAAQSNGEDASDLCLLMEIIADLPSPETEQTKRMELQVQRLADGLGKGLSAEEEATQLIERWLQSKADEAQTERFVKALKQVI